MVASVTDIQLIGENPAFLHLLNQASHWASIARPILIQGERGVGKELIAARLHYLSPRWQEPYVVLNCAAIPESLMDSELFGAEAGAYTGALKSRAGKLERAHGGTLFLDEIASMPMIMQEKLLRFMEYGEVERLGGNATLTLDVRIVAASNVHLQGLARMGKFRPDLLDRLAFDVLTVPPLRVRGEDILSLADFFAQGATKEKGAPFFCGFSDQARETLLRYPWPGNVRELKNVVERAVFQTENVDEPIDQLVFDAFDSPYCPPAELTIALEEKSAGNLPAMPENASVPVAGDLRAEVAAFENKRIQQALQSTQYQIRPAATLLGMNYHQLRHLMKKHKIHSKAIS